MSNKRGVLVTYRIMDCTTCPFCVAYVIGGIREKGREWAFKCNLSPARLDLRWLRGESIPSKVPKHCPLITKSIAAAFKDLVTFRTRLAKGEEFINCEKK